MTDIHDDFKNPITLAELKSRPCTLEELQAFLIKLTDLYNLQSIEVAAAINNLRSTKANKEWRANI